MNQKTKDNLIEAMLIGVKILTALKTALDTYMVALSQPDWRKLHFDLPALGGTVLIDGAFTAFWFAIAYGGNSDLALAAKPWFAAGAWFLYILIVLIGTQAHHENFGEILFTIGVRVAAAIALAKDTQGYFVALRLKREKKTVEELQEELEKKVMARALKGAVSSKVKEDFEEMAVLITKQRLLYQSELLHPGIVSIMQATRQPKLSWIDRLLNVFRSEVMLNSTPLIELPAAAGMEYTELPDGNIVCATCGWQSSKGSRTHYNKEQAFNIHRKSNRHLSVNIGSNATI